ncbi:hypothetical protein Bcell_1182 [Evansella cellulosilytica DSM 2522]|uniref:Uncharacterized protein n=1 Tax=Evansella cellulosilytica (strain ATCC 21833 / DSM 2522 / FERM P-1141 / JCM 9156 / N-4) TaxID=649639 RepID=E6TRS4_EVAC2|nr:hypothetical protein Bcell_1182 [Evansella cellulosilytica DSM 2522]
MQTRFPRAAGKPPQCCASAGSYLCLYSRRNERRFVANATSCLDGYASKLMLVEEETVTSLAPVSSTLSINL